MTMSRFLPIILGVAAILGLTFVQIRMTDRLSGTNVSATQRAELLNLVPKNIGDWHGEDKEVDPTVRKTSGAIGAVSRLYRNVRTGDQVDLWLIVGHARDVSFHTPDVCYPGSGFEARATENSLYPMVVTGLPDTPFWTNTFYREDERAGRRLLRVFWSWYNPESEENQGKVMWEAPHNARWRFGNTRALYKMYFTSEMRDPMETTEQSACLRFARDFLPEVNKALAEVHKKLQAEEGATSDVPQTPAPAAATPSEIPKAESGASAEKTDVAAEKTPAEAPPATLAPLEDKSKYRLELAEPAAPPAKADQ